MSDKKTPPAAKTPAPTPATPPPGRARVDDLVGRHKRDPLLLLYLLGFVVLAGTLAYLYQHPNTPREVQQATSQVGTLQSDVQGLQGRVAALETKAPPPEADIQALVRRVATLESRPVPQPPNLQPLEARIAALENKPPPPPFNPAPLEARIAALENKPPPPPFNPAPINARIDALKGRLAAVEAGVKQVAGQIGAVAERSNRVTRLQSALAALEAGKRLGDIPGAPPAVARFAEDPPPTEAALRQSFEQAAAAAQRMERPVVMENKNFGQRLWTRAQQAVSVREGDKVLVGDPVGATLDHARTLLDKGDLAGAVRALEEGLSGPALAAMGDWIGQAKALLEARAALSNMLARG